MSTSKASNRSFSDMNRKHRDSCMLILRDMLSEIFEATGPRLYINVHEYTKDPLIKYSATRDVKDTLLWDMDII